MNIFYDTHDSFEMGLTRIRMMPCTYPNTKGKIRSTSCKVEEASYHASTEFLIYFLPLKVTGYFSIRSHGIASGLIFLDQTFSLFLEKTLIVAISLFLEKKERRVAYQRGRKRRGELRRVAYQWGSKVRKEEEIS